MMMMMKMMKMMTQSTGVLFSSFIFSELSRQLVETTEDVRASSFSFRQISIVVQRFNYVTLHNGFIDNDRHE